MQRETSQRLTPRAAYELLGEANAASVTTLVRASALAEEQVLADRAQAER